MDKKAKNKRNFGLSHSVADQLFGIKNSMDAANASNESDPNIAMVSINEIEVNPWQPRTEFEKEALSELSESIKVHGIIQPITVRRLKNAAVPYQLVSGERRLRASQMAGLKEVPTYIREATDQEMVEMALIENIQREDLSPLELAETYLKLRDELKLDPIEISKRVAKKESTIRNYIRLLKLPEPIKDALKNKEISMGHAKALLGLEDPIAQTIIFKNVKENNLSVRATEALVAGYENPKKKTGGNTTTLPSSVSAAYREIEDGLRNLLSAKVELKKKPTGKGQIIINFSDDSELNRILELLEKGTF